MRLLKFILAAALLGVMLPAEGQNLTPEEYARKRREAYDSYKSERNENIQRYKEKANRDYAERMKGQWEYRQLQKGTTPPPSPDPVTPPRAGADAPSKSPVSINPTNVPIVTPKPQPKPTPQPAPPTAPAAGERKSVKVSFYGSDLLVGYTPSMIVRLGGSDEIATSKMWTELSDGRANLWLSEMFALRKRLALCDWAYYKLVEKASVALMGKSNEAVLLQAYTLVQSGLNLRLSRRGESLCILLPAKEDLYSYSYVNIEGAKYYVITDGKSEGGVHIFNTTFPETHTPSMQITIPNLPTRPSQTHAHASERYPSLVVTASANVNVVEFFNDCPRSASWQNYTNANLSSHLKKQLYPVLKREIANKSPEEAAGVLLNFVQTGFAYKTDAAHFGYERALYGEEMFYYSYSDCEDRSILYAILVRDLLGLDVVLLEFENHLATAVRFPSAVKGDDILVGSERYIVCDPTYINASVGMMMPKMNGKLRNIITLK